MAGVLVTETSMRVRGRATCDIAERESCDSLHNPDEVLSWNIARTITRLTDVIMEGP